MIFMCSNMLQSFIEDYSESIIEEAFSFATNSSILAAPVFESTPIQPIEVSGDPICDLNKSIDLLELKPYSKHDSIFENTCADQTNLPSSRNTSKQSGISQTELDSNTEPTHDINPIDADLDTESDLQTGPNSNPEPENTENSSEDSDNDSRSSDISHQRGKSKKGARIPLQQAGNQAVSFRPSA